ncbi:Peptide methionine sulfoxide reductase MsrA/MsrB, partial [Haemophilus influenzae]
NRTRAFRCRANKSFCSEITIKSGLF